jgi:CheY-like chemotaxis protein
MARILVIDDSPVMRNLLREFLESEGHEVEVAVDGEEGITKLLSGTYQIAFCDLHMPRRNGFQVFEFVSPQRTALQFVFTDSMPDSFTEQLAASDRFIVLRKPFDLQQIRRVLATLIPGAVADDLSR